MFKFKPLTTLTALAACLVVHSIAYSQDANQTDKQVSGGMKPTVVLVHGAFADSNSWNGVIKNLASKGYTVIGAANPLRGVQVDSKYVADIVKNIHGPVVLVGHSYGGTVITNAARSRNNVKALVYVSAFAPEKGETVAGLAGRFPGSTLGEALSTPVALSDGNKDLYIQQQKFRQQFADDVPDSEATLVAAVTQRPITEKALTEPSGAAAWKKIPSWFVYGTSDKNIPAAALSYMAKRAGSKKTIEIEGGSHVVMISHPDAVAQLIDEASRAK